MAKCTKNKHNCRSSQAELPCIVPCAEEEITSFIRSETVRYAAVIKAAGIKPE